MNRGSRIQGVPRHVVNHLSFKEENVGISNFKMMSKGLNQNRHRHSDSIIKQGVTMVRAKPKKNPMLHLKHSSKILSKHDITTPLEMADSGHMGRIKHSLLL